MPVSYAYFNNSLLFIRQTTSYERGISFVAITPKIAYYRLAYTSYLKRKINQLILKEEIDSTNLFNYKAYCLAKSKQIISRLPQIRAEKASDMLYTNTQYIKPIAFNDSKYVVIVTNNTIYTYFP